MKIDILQIDTTSAADVLYAIRQILDCPPEENIMKYAQAKMDELSYLNYLFNDWEKD